MKHAGAATAQVHTLHPGDLACVGRGARLETLLGSCVAIVLTDPRRTVGAMCHIVHAGVRGDAAQRSGAFAEVALEGLYGLLRQRGITPSLCEAYVYGGGNMFPALVQDPHVGDANADWALEALARQGIKVVLHDLGGTAYRRLGWTVGDQAPAVVAIEV